MILVDACVLLDVVRVGARWAIGRRRNRSTRQSPADLLVNPIICAEFSVWHDASAGVNQVLAGLSAAFKHIPHAALFLASEAFHKYDTLRCTRTSVIPDLLIRTQAAVRELLPPTRDTARYRRHFPTIALMSPTPA